MQTLAHLNQFFQWEHINSQYANGGRPPRRVGRGLYLNPTKCWPPSLLALQPKRIHLGMDEAYDLGQGHYIWIKSGLAS